MPSLSRSIYKVNSVMMAGDFAVWDHLVRAAEWTLPMWEDWGYVIRNK